MAERSTFSRKYLAWLLVPALVIAAAVAWFVLDPGFRNAAPQEARAPETADEFGRRVRDYLLEHPEVLVEAMQRLETRQRAAEADAVERSEEHTSELQSLMRTSYAVFCLKQKKNKLDS